MTTAYIQASFDRAAVLSQVKESAKHASGVRFPNAADAEFTVDLIFHAWKAFDGRPIQVGEFVKCGDVYRRVAYIWSHDEDGCGTVALQFADVCGGSYYLFSGSGSYSGSLDHTERIRISAEPIGWKEAPYWIFWCGRGGAHCGVHFKLPTRVFKLEQE